MELRTGIGKITDDLSRVQLPDAENRMSGGVEGLRGEIPVSPSDPKQNRITPQNIYARVEPRRSVTVLSASFTSTMTECRHYN